MLRIPQEPDVHKYPERDTGILIPAPFDFASSEKPGVHKTSQHKNACIQLALQLSDLVNEPHRQYIHHLRNARVALNESIEIDVQVDTVEVAGASADGLVGVRHVATVPMSPKSLIYGYSRIVYTDLIDKYTYLVDLVEDCSIHETATGDWCHVAYTADTLSPILSDREFVTFDFCAMQHNLQISRSCLHSDRPATQPPGFFNCDKRLYRVPLFWFLRALEIPGKPDQCKIVQFQYSDIGGIVPVPDQIKAVVQFGMENTPKVVSFLMDAKRKGADFGETNGRIQDPLKPSWRQNPYVMLGLEKE